MSYAIPPPPPPPPPEGILTQTGASKYQNSLEEWQWTADKTAYIDTGAWLTANRAIGSIYFYSQGQSPSVSTIRLNGHSLDVTSGTIHLTQDSHFSIEGPGSITASSGLIQISSQSQNRTTASISSSIIDTYGKKNQLYINSGVNAFLTGNSSNTYTGPTVINQGGILNLNKTNGATAIQGDIIIQGGVLIISGSNQISDNSIINISDNYDIKLHPAQIIIEGTANTSIVEKVKSINLSNSGTIMFATPKSIGTQSYLYLEDLYIYNYYNSELEVRNWADGFDHLLVKKSSRHLDDALKRVTFGPGTRGHKREWAADTSYWEIYARPLPEASTYGAAFTVGILGLAVFRKRKRTAQVPARINSPRQLIPSGAPLAIRGRS